ncbi:MAG TPA: tRNA dihydrouridine synthase DusB [Woeseiaceae bacterium]|nr:tRNA dihydrouridine synthase DusB [Woeseiaceae bacterium]|tara:strand:+ start:12463 stop:13428 length:966 start_codon:yes stop_codon:yes gene_type:complete
MQIGKFKLDSPFLLAPMAGITDAPFRRLCAKFGAGLTVSEMTTSDISLWNTTTSTYRLNLDMNIEPRVVQIAGSDPSLLATAAKLCVDRGAQIIDINMGCPAKKVCNKHAGSALMKDEKMVKLILETVVNAVKVPVTLKMRTGWCPEQKNGLEIAHIAESSGIQAIAIHGRTRACRFSGNAEYKTIAHIKKKISIPIIANGDINSPEKSLEVFRISNADALMIGRSSRGKPWIFRDLNYYLKKQKHITPLEKNNVRDTMLEHLLDLYQFYGEELGVRFARKHLSWYCMHLEDTTTFKKRVVRVNKASKQIELVEEFFQKPV